MLVLFFLFLFSFLFYFLFFYEQLIFYNSFLFIYLKLSKMDVKLKSQPSVPRTLNCPPKSQNCPSISNVMCCWKCFPLDIIDFYLKCSMLCDFVYFSHHYYEKGKSQQHLCS